MASTTRRNPKDAPVRKQVLACTRAGLKPREIAGALEISTQRVYQHLARLRELGDLPETDSAA